MNPDHEDDDTPLHPAAGRLPLAIGSDGQPYLPANTVAAYLPANTVAAYLRAIAESCRTLNGDPDCDLHTLANTLDLEADALQVRAIAATR